jgi:hypothetical protein
MHCRKGGALLSIAAQKKSISWRLLKRHGRSLSVHRENNFEKNFREKSAFSMRKVQKIAW